MPPGLRSIGQVLAILKPDFDDISISKIRFLESEGLIQPERAPSGYRRYADVDVARLRYILDVQKNHYLPLRVIREHLEAI
ncbi:MAG TPA: MerR family transcriptional regulator, partial [Propionibacteriaceae bacterium]|nr:MerR family transcriptional regulator [Propionibacteriaceae bacterium]